MNTNHKKNESARSLKTRDLATLSAAGEPESSPESAALPSNDNATRASLADTTPLVADRDVVRYLRATLARYGVEWRDMDDAVADVQTRAIEVARTRRMPSNVQEWKALAVTIAVGWAIDRLREADTAQKYDAGPCEDPDRYMGHTLYWEQRDPVDTKRYLAILKDLFDSGQMPEDGPEILQGEADGVPHEELARELGISRRAVGMRLVRMRDKFYGRLAALGMLVVLLLMLLAVFDRRSDDEVAAPAPSVKPEPTRVERVGDAAAPETPDAADAGALPDAAGWR